MFGFNWLLRRLAAPQRNTFAYFDGRRLRSIDPLVAYRRLTSFEGFDWDRDPERVANGNDKAMERTVEAVRSTFGVPAWTDDGESGLTEEETYMLLISFVEYMVEQKKSGSLFPILPERTEPEPSTEPSETTPNFDSGSTSTASGRPCESPTESSAP
jgi:hypothetical protein